MIIFKDFISHPFSLPPLLSSFYFLGLGLFVLSKNWKKEVNLSFFILSWSCFMWLFNYAVCFTRTNETEALFWSRNAYFGIIFISVAFQHWTSTTLGLKKYVRYSYLGYALAATFLPITRMPIFLGGVKKYFWGYYPFVGSWVYSFFVVVFTLHVFSLVYVVALPEYIKAKKSGISPLTVQRIKYIFLAVFFISLGTVDYLAKFKIPVYPIGYLFVFCFLSLVAYSIIRYRLFEIDTVIHRTLLWVLTSCSVLLPIGVLLYFMRFLLNSLGLLELTFAVTALFYVFLYYFGKIQPKIDHLFRRRKYDYYSELAQIPQRIGSELDTKSIIGRLFKELTGVLYVRNALILIRQEPLNVNIERPEASSQFSYLEIGSCGYDKIPEERAKQRKEAFFSSSSPLTKWILTHQRALEREQVEVDPGYEKIKEDAGSFFKENCLELLVPVIMEEKVNAVIGIGKKENLSAYTLKDISLLETIGKQLGLTIDNALHHEDIVEKERLAEELRLGRDIQMNLLPKQLPRISNLSVDGLMLPAKEIGGDYYDFITLPGQDELGIAIGDVSGKGVAAGLLMAMAKTAIHTLSQRNVSPKELLLRTNSILYKHIGGQKFMTMLYFQYKASNRMLSYSSAGHEHILIHHNKTGSIESILSGGFMLGMLDDITSYIEDKTITLEPGDKVILYTDGVTEALSPSGDRFGMDRLIESFKNHSSKAPFELIQDIKSDVYSFMQTQPQYDDITLVGMEAI